MCEKEDLDISVSRRKVLKSSGALAGMNLVGVVPDRSSSPIETHIVEVGVEYSVETSIDESKLPVVHFDMASDYRVDPSSKSAITNPYADNHAIAVLAMDENDFLVHANQYQPGGGQLFTEQTTQLTHSMEPDFRSTYRLQTLQPVDQHTVSVDRDGEAAIVKAPGVDESIPTTIGSDGRRREGKGSGMEHFRSKLPEKEVDVEITKILDERVSNPDVKERHRPLKKQKEKRTITVRPELRVRNLGKIPIQKGKPV